MNEIVFRVVLPSYLALAIAAVLIQRRTILRDTRREPIRTSRPGQTDSPAAFAASVLIWATLVCVTDIVVRAVWPRLSEELLTCPALGAAVGARWAGLGVASLGVGLYVTGLFEMGPSWRVGIDSEQPGPLVTTGLFRYVRHPLYSGILLATAGLALLTADVLAIPATAAAWTTLPIQARLEEEFLAARYPAYDLYRKGTGRFVPKWR